MVKNVWANEAWKFPSRSSSFESCGLKDYKKKIGTVAETNNEVTWSLNSNNNENGYHVNFKEHNVIFKVLKLRTTSHILKTMSPSKLGRAWLPDAFGKIYFIRTHTNIYERESAPTGNFQRFKTIIQLISENNNNTGKKNAEKLA